ncbi:F-box/kelch-repeat protein At3g24760-like [Juglans microcarpa x Juglans regia]|uniref:F-box/kelch-repeat protein At3g24760-like n=1 Tax=Juglans microcarpa x Juglans regia TaxID=2249226 RepID=UPI001B7EF96B|nr:F-box/kelch-repeat protein At3g24760-like [Juglans microcarpa x Juglans regia]
MAEKTDASRDLRMRRRGQPNLSTHYIFYSCIYMHLLLLPSSSNSIRLPKMTEFSILGFDLTEHILSFLPIPTLLRAASVCKLWHSIISSPAFSSPSARPHALSQPWFFLYGLHNTSSKNHQSFAFDPLSNLWFRLPSSSSFPFLSPTSSSLIGSQGFLFTTAPFSFSPILHRFSDIFTTSPPNYSRDNPLLGVFHANSDKPTFIVVGGVRFIGNLVDIEDRLAVEIYDPHLDSWEICPPLPANFSSGNSSSSLSSALFGGKFYVLGIYSCFVSSFDLEKHIWSDVQTLRPPGVNFSFLLSCRDRLVLAGICNSPLGSSFNLWRIDENTMEFSEIAIMPQDLLYSLFDSDEDDKFASLKCVGLGDLVYVFNEENHKRCPACVCEISSDQSGKCKWRRVPPLPSPVNKFHKVISFCSTVSLRNMLRVGEELSDR